MALMHLAALFLTATCAHADFQLPPLPFDLSATEPVISAQANKFHHDNHHAGYVSNVNKLVKESGDQKLEEYTLSELISSVGTGELKQAKDWEQKLRNFGGGAWNHNLWWRILSSWKAEETQLDHISDDLQEAIIDRWGSVESMIDELKQKAKDLFGSGWIWLIVKEDSMLAITTTQKQDNPLMGWMPEEKRGIPIFGIDVWEHAFYLTYGPMKPKFVEDFWDLVNWEQVSKNYEIAKKGEVEDIIGKEWNEY